jgi:hypothetical protein
LTTLTAVPLYINNDGQTQIGEYTHNENISFLQHSYIDSGTSNTNDVRFDDSVMCQADDSFMIENSQPISNQHFFTQLDISLYNLSKYLYIDQLMKMTLGDEGNISMYRNILLQRAKKSENCPQGVLVIHRTTKLENCSKRYASDCHALQEFINNNDPKVRMSQQNAFQKRCSLKLLK